MPLRFLCPACHQLLSIATRKAGSEVDCPKCRSTIIVPAMHSAGTDVSNPFDEAALEETLSVIESSRAAPAKPPATAAPSSNSAASGGLLHGEKSKPQREMPDGDSIVISRRVLYLQAGLLALVAVIAFICGYFIGAAR